MRCRQLSPFDLFAASIALPGKTQGRNFRPKITYNYMASRARLGDRAPANEQPGL